jgi:succinate dehydrogenase/fumarate reductase flavoprotein subunit
VTKLRDTVQRAMTRGAGVVRSAESLAGARAVVEEATSVLGDPSASAGTGELANLLRLADALLSSALARTESRGAHARREYPDALPSWRRRLVHGHVPVDGVARHG